MATHPALATPSNRRAAACLAGLRMAVGRSLLGSLALVSMVLLVRRISGAMSAPLPAGWLALLAIAAVAAAWLGRRAMATSAVSDASKQAGSLTAALPSVACVLLAAALSLPGTSASGLVLLWSIVALAEGCWWVGAARGRPGMARPGLRQTAERDDLHMVQQARRDRLADGGEQVAGWIRVDVPAGERMAHVHVGFCPPLAGAPLIDVRQRSGPPARLKLGQSLAYGARFELRLAEPGPASLVLEYTATRGARTEG